MTEELGEKTAADLKQIAKTLGVAGYSKMKKDELIAAIQQVQGTPKNAAEPPSAEASAAMSRARTRVAYSREESEQKIEQDKKYTEKQHAEIARHAPVPQGGTGTSKQPARGGGSKSKPASSKPAKPSAASELASTLASAPREAQGHAPPPAISTGSNAAPLFTAPAPVDAAERAPRQGKARPPVIVKSGNKPVTPDAGTSQATTNIHAGNETRPVPIPPVPKQDAKRPGKDVVKPSPPPPRVPSQEKPIDRASVKPPPPLPPVPKQETRPSTGRVQESIQEGPRLQDLPGGEQRDILNKKVTKSTRKLLELRRKDFSKMNAKKLESILDALEIEKSRFTVYNPTDKMVRRFIDESISIIHGVREEQLNEIEHKWTDAILPELLKKNKGKVEKLVSKLDRYYTEMDCARDIVDLLKMKKSPFPTGYWVTLINQRIREKSLL